MRTVPLEPGVTLRRTTGRLPIMSLQFPAADGHGGVWVGKLAQRFRAMISTFNPGLTLPVDSGDVIVATESSSGGLASYRTEISLLAIVPAAWVRRSENL